MRKTVIALLLVIAMLFVSCKPENTVKEPTAEEFLPSLYAKGICMDLLDILNKAKDDSGKIDTTKINVDDSDASMSYVFQNIDELSRYHVTEVTSVTGTVKSEKEAENVVISFKYYRETRTEGGEWPTTHEGEASEGVVAFSITEEITGTEYNYSNIRLNFNPYKDGYTPSLNSAETKVFKSISFVSSDGDKLDSASVEGVKLNDAELEKVSDDIIA